VNPLAPRLLLAGALLAAAGAAQAQSDADLRAGSYLAGNCANCHGTAGRSTGALPPLAGIARDGLVKAMRDFRDGRRNATIMHQISKGYTDQQVELMAEYFSRQKAN
jgi:sulfide dehydrogenase cytochrome subunit